MFYAAAAYCDPLILLQWNCGTACSANPGVITVRPIIYASANSYTFGFVTYNPLTNKIIVAFRGTNGVPTDLATFRTLQSFLNWKTNIGYTLSLYETGGKVHRGFNRAYSSVKTQIRSSVKFLLKTFSGAQVLVTGHSLGGALATLAAVDLKRLHQSVHIQLYTFGSPRVGNRAFAKYIYTLFPLGTVYRIVNAGDIVPHTPTFLQKYVHVGIEVWYPNSNTVTYKQCVLQPSALIFEDPTCSISGILDLDLSSHLQYLMYPITNLCSFEEPMGCAIDSNDISLIHSVISNHVLPLIHAKTQHSMLLNISHSNARCLGHCNSLGCNNKTGICYDSCSDATKWWGPRCDQPCLGHCNGLGCDKDNGLCRDSCSDATQWWGKQCDQPCLGHCNGLGCDKDNGLCRDRCSDATKWWGKQCDKVCGGHCNRMGCRQETGFCHDVCSDSTKWWGRKCCNNSCIGNCNSLGCDIETGLCKDSCSDSTKWWGPRCDQPCLGHCNGLGCNKDNGLCRDRCFDATKWWGKQCDQPCMGHCNSLGCQKDDGLCYDGCEKSLWWGPQCAISCYNCIKHCGCYKATGTCACEPRGSVVN